jgi:hypothetical protein
MITNKFKSKLNKALLVAEGKLDDKSNILHDLETVSKSMNIPMTIIGGMAVAAHNYPRYTNDIDIIVKSSDAKKLADYLLSINYEDIGQNKLKHVDGAIVNICAEGVHAGSLSFPAPQNISGVSIADLPFLLALKSEANRYKDRADVVELIKRNNLTANYIEQQVIPLIRNQISKMRIRKLLEAAIKESN